MFGFEKIKIWFFLWTVLLIIHSAWATGVFLIDCVSDWFFSLLLFILFTAVWLLPIYIIIAIHCLTAFYNSFIALNWTFYPPKTSFILLLIIQSGAISILKPCSGGGQMVLIYLIVTFVRVNVSLLFRHFILSECIKI